MKITRSTLKAFIKRNAGNLYAKVTSNFDGMQDCVISCKDSNFKKIETGIDFSKKYNFGINGLWLVGQSRDYFNTYSDGQFEGIEIYNCCRSSVIVRRIA